MPLCDIYELADPADLVDDYLAAEAVALLSAFLIADSLGLAVVDAPKSSDEKGPRRSTVEGLSSSCAMLYTRVPSSSQIMT